MSTVLDFIEQGVPAQHPLPIVAPSAFALRSSSSSRQQQLLRAARQVSLLPAYRKSVARQLRHNTRRSASHSSLPSSQLAMWPSSSSNGGGETSSSSHYDNRRAQEAEFDAAYETARRAAQAEEREQAGAAAAAAYQADGCTPRRRTHSAASAPEAPSSSSHLPYTQNPGYGATQDVETQSIKLAGSRPLSRASMRFQRPGGHARGNSVYSTTSVAQGNLGYLFLDHPESIAENSGDESPRLMSSPRRGKGVMRPGSRIPSAQGLLDEHLQSPPVPPLPLSAELSGDEERTAVLSPEEAWYTLRALVGAEIETEKGMLWRLRHLDAREDLFGRNGDEE